MTNFRRTSAAACATAVLALPLLSLFSSLGFAADHADAPASTDDPAADLTDVYAWHTDDRVVVAVGFSGLAEAGIPANYDRDVLYTINVDNNADDIADHEVYVRFGQNEGGDWGVQVENLPGATGTIAGPVETELDAGLGLRVFAGLRDDAFFFDLDGFKMTAMSGDLSFDNTRDTFAGTNITLMVVEMSRDAVAGGSDNLQIWATTARK